MNIGKLLGILTPFANNKQLLVDDQDTDDIISHILKAHKKYASDYDKISDYFWKGNAVDTSHFVFDFLKKNVVYSIEPESRQSVKSPAAILSTGAYKSGGNDCKHYSLFQAGIYDSLRRKGKKIDWCFRFANYKLLSTTPHHVFIVIKDNGTEYWSDPVLDYFNQRKAYINKIDKCMPLYSISGIGRTRKHTAAKIALFPGRKAFLLLVRLNFDKFALKLYRRLNSYKRNELLNKWKKLGGNPNLLISTVNKAVAKYRRKHPNVKIGAEPVSVTIIATAAPIITALLKFLKPEKADEITDASQAVQQSIENYRASKETNNTDSTDTTDTNTEQATVSGMNPYFLYGGLGLFGLYLLTTKKQLFR